ncbi:hypothetical protein [Streptomyces sp. NBC_01187]|uniref:hypothetical protein n=1 Tax=Streptomyces sp. NBC_01187 TaxID=2903766 RepID=UPI0038696CBA|nr:hypothetical protein OG220_18365 [Streptomyces sp. NBC_01187]
MSEAETSGLGDAEGTEGADGTHGAERAGSAEGADGAHSADGAHGAGEAVGAPVNAARGPRRRLRAAAGWLVRGRLRTALVAALAGALVASALTAWQPWKSEDGDEQALCWGTLRFQDVKGLWRADLTPHGKDIPPSSTDRSVDGTCQVTATMDTPSGPLPKTRLTARLRQLDSYHSAEDAAWPTNHLEAGMTPIGKGVTGLVSGNHAWIALPEQCASGFMDAGPAVVEVDTGSQDMSLALRPGLRTVLARTAVKLANGALRGLDCDGTLSVPERLPEPPRVTDASGKNACGVPGLRVRGLERYDVTYATRAPGVARVCALSDSSGSRSGHDDLRLTTVEEPRLVRLLESGQFTTGAQEHGEHGRALFRDGEASYRTSCPSGSVLFLVEDRKPPRDTSGAPADRAAELLPRYAAAEAERLGCGPLDTRELKKR